MPRLPSSQQSPAGRRGPGLVRIWTSPRICIFQAISYCPKKPTLSSCTRGSQPPQPHRSRGMLTVVPPAPPDTKPSWAAWFPWPHRISQASTKTTGTLTSLPGCACRPLPLHRQERLHRFLCLSQETDASDTPALTQLGGARCAPGHPFPSPLMLGARLLAGSCQHTPHRWPMGVHQQHQHPGVP